MGPLPFLPFAPAGLALPSLAPLFMPFASGSGPPPSLTVTTTATGSFAIAGTLAVQVLTGAAAAASQPGAVHTSTNVPPEATLTPNATGSLPYAVLSVFPGAAGLVAFNSSLLATTFSGPANTAFGSVVTGPTTAATPVTYGASSPAGQFNNIAQVEILAAGTIAVDGSTPAAVTDPAASVLHTASFAPPHGSVLVACAAGAATTIAVSDSLGLTWVLLQAFGTYTAIWAATVP